MIPQCKSSEVIFQTPWFSVRSETFETSETEQSSPYYIIEGGDGCLTIPFTSDERIIMVRQFRPAIRQFTIEFPAGAIDANEEPQVSAERELLEETGYRPTSIQKISSGHMMMNRFAGSLHAFVATDCIRINPGATVDSTELVLVTWDEFLSFLRTNKFTQMVALGFLYQAQSKGLLPSWAKLC